MLRDRSSEFRRQARKNFPDDIALDRLSSGRGSSGTSFLAEIDEIRRVMEKLDNDIESMMLKQRSILAQAAVDPNEKEKLDEAIATIRGRASGLKQLLLMMRSNDGGSWQDLSPNTDVNQRIRRSHFQALTSKLCNLIEKFNAAQLDYRSMCLKRIKRQLDLAGEHITDEDVNAMIDSKSTQIFYRDVRPSEALKSALDDASLRHNEILKLEASINELNHLYSDLAFFVQTQGETVDRIDKNIDDAVGFVETGNLATQAAVQYKRAEMTKKLYCALILGIILIILITLLVVYLTTR